MTARTRRLCSLGIDKGWEDRGAANKTRRFRHRASRRKNKTSPTPRPLDPTPPLLFHLQDSDDGGATARIVTISVLGVVGALMLANVVLYYLAQSQKGASGGKKKKVGAKKAKRQAMMGGMRVLGD